MTTTPRAREFLKDRAADWGIDGPKGITSEPYSRILDWALGTDAASGQLPTESAKPFANWLNGVWDDFADDEEATVEDVLKGAVTQWCGGRTF